MLLGVCTCSWPSPPVPSLSTIVILFSLCAILLANFLSDIDLSKLAASFALTPEPSSELEIFSLDPLDGIA